MILFSLKFFFSSHVIIQFFLSKMVDQALNSLFFIQKIFSVTGEIHSDSEKNYSGTEKSPFRRIALRNGSISRNKFLKKTLPFLLPYCYCKTAFRYWY